MAEQKELYFEEIEPGDSAPSRQYGPLTIVDTVRWAGLQENWQHLHFDRDHVQRHNGLRTFIASGAYRQALLMRMLTDWIGPRGMLRRPRSSPRCRWIAIGAAGSRLAVTQPLVQVPGLVLLTVAEALVRFALLKLFRFPAPLGELMAWVVLPQALYNGFLGAVFVLALSWIESVRARSA